MTYALLKKVWVVLGENGEYSDRCVYVSGVYSTKEAAKAALLKGLEAYRDRENWHRENEAIAKGRPRLRDYNYPLGVLDILNIAEAKTLNPRPEPPYEGAERASIDEVELDVWGHEGWPDCFEAEWDEPVAEVIARPVK